MLDASLIMLYTRITVSLTTCGIVKFLVIVRCIWYKCSTLSLSSLRQTVSLRTSNKTVKYTEKLGRQQGIMTKQQKVVVKDDF